MSTAACMRWAERATEAYEDARGRVQRFLNARNPARSSSPPGRPRPSIWWPAAGVPPILDAGDRDHPFDAGASLQHRALADPARRVRHRDRRGTGRRCRRASISRRLGRLSTSAAGCVAIAHVSNAFGSVLPVAEIARLAHAAGARVLIDGCQAVPHQPVDVRALDCDFYVFAGHKLYGPTGIGVLYVRGEILAAMPPWQGGGEMIRSVTFERTGLCRSPCPVRSGHAQYRRRRRPRCGHRLCRGDRAAGDRRVTNRHCSPMARPCSSASTACA